MQLPGPGGYEAAWGVGRSRKPLAVHCHAGALALERDSSVSGHALLWGIQEFCADGRDQRRMLKRCDALEGACRILWPCRRANQRCLSQSAAQSAATARMLAGCELHAWPEAWA